MHCSKLHVRDGFTVIGALIAALSLCACGTEEPKSTDVETDENGRYFPLAVGNHWEYQVTNPETDETYTKTQTVEALEAVEGKPDVVAYRLRTETGALVTLSWQEDGDVEVLRHLEHSFDVSGNLTVTESYDPYKLRVDERPEHTVEGATYSQTYTETTTDVVLGVTAPPFDKEERWLVEAAEEEVTVPAGTFPCLRLKRTGVTTETIKTYFFARGIGKVKETGGRTEELMSYELIEEP